MNGTFTFDAFYESDSHDEEETPIIAFEVNGVCTSVSLRLTLTEAKAMVKEIQEAINDAEEPTT